MSVFKGLASYSRKLVNFRKTLHIVVAARAGPKIMGI